ncbi:hypothetical protein [Bacillus thuringiensis]|uniref:hypothetical protein n=1 Tax=Bacillus thuringiensis TaxID=1428 RepID=UPI00159B95AB|nr:hypothetical protein [Bacillus thuringiensis]
MSEKPTYEGLVATCLNRLKNGENPNAIYEDLEKEGVWGVDSIEYALDEAEAEIEGLGA